MKPDLENHINEAAKRLSSGAQPKKLLEEYASKMDLHDAFYVVTQAQIQAKKR